MDPQSTVEGERRFVTILFADIKESTTLISGDDPEKSIDLLYPVVQQMIRAVENYGGVTLNVMGDGIMAVFGAPGFVEHHERQACYAGLAIQGGREGAQSGENPPSIQVRIGIHTGEIVLSATGDGDEKKYDLYGFNTHIAARMESLAKGDGIVISEDTYKSVSRFFHCEALGERLVKGSVTPINVFALKSSISDREFRAQQPRPFVGRETEFKVMTDVLRDMEVGKGRIVTIVGPAGIGKTRFLAEVIRQHQGDSSLWLSSGNSLVTQTVPFWFLKRILMTFFEIDERDNPNESVRKISNVINDLFPERSQPVIPYLLEFLGINIPDNLSNTVRKLDGEEFKRQIFRIFRRLLRRLNRRGPVVLVLDDVYFADNASMELVKHLFPLVAEHSFVICFITRDEKPPILTQLPTLLGEKYTTVHQEIRLNPLNEVEGKLLLKGFSDDGTLTSAITQQIIAKTQGNPLFLEQVSQTVLEAGTDATGGPDHHLTQSNTLLAIPNNIKETIRMRVDRIDRRYRSTLRMASVIGMTFDAQILAAALEGEVDVTTNLQTLESYNLIFSYGNELGERFSFQHVLIQEAIYESILQRERNQFHEIIGIAIETHFKNHLEHYYGLLAFHFSRSETWVKAHTYLMKIGDQADRLAGDAEALAHFSDAVEAYSNAFGESWDPLERALIDGKVGGAYFRRGERSQSIFHLERALSGLGERLPTTTIRTRLGLGGQVLWSIMYQSLVRPLKVKARSEPGKEVGRTLDLYDMLWWLHIFEDQERSFYYSFRAMRISERFHHNEGVAWTSATTGFFFDVMGFPKIASLFNNRAEQVARNSPQNDLSHGYSTLGRGWHELYLGNSREAENLLDEAAKLTWRSGNFRQWESATVGLSFVKVLCGDFAGAREYANHLSAIGEDTNDVSSINAGRLMGAMADVRQGKVSEALPILQELLDYGRINRDHIVFLFSGADVLYGMLLLDQIEEAQSLVFELQSEITKRKLKGHHVALANNRIAEVGVRLYGRTGQGRRTVQISCRKARASAKIFNAAMPTMQRLLGVQCWISGKPALARQWWDKSLSSAEKLHSPYEMALTHMELAEWADDGVSREEASRLATQLELSVFRSANKETNRDIVAQ